MFDCKRSFLLLVENGPTRSALMLNSRSECMHCTAWLHTLSLCEYFDRYGGNRQREVCVSINLVQLISWWTVLETFLFVKRATLMRPSLIQPCCWSHFPPDGADKSMERQWRGAFSRFCKNIEGAAFNNHKTGLHTLKKLLFNCLGLCPCPC